VFVVELTGKRVQKFTTSGSPLAVIGSAGTGPGQFQDPTGIAVDAGGRIYVADYTRQRILRFLPDGSFDMEFATPGPPSDMAVGPDGNIYVIRFEVGQVYQYSSGGVLLQSFGSPAGLDGAYRIAIGPGGTMYIGEQYNTRVSIFQIDQATPGTTDELWTA
jgi:DNA-binding beta-propeller fold protein YncE